jgi:lipopolysaccharide export system protein LptA
MKFRNLLLLAALAVLVPGTAAAQGDCLVERFATQNTVNMGTPQQMTYVTGASIVCGGGRRISADNAYITSASGIVRLMGNVQFQDPDRTLRSANAEYYTNTRRLSASGSVVLVHRTTNSTIRSERLEYTEAVGQREALVQAMGGRPQAIFRQAGQQDSTILWAQQIDIIGNDRLRGTGDSRLERDSLVAIGYVIDYDPDNRRLDLSGLQTSVELPSYRLVGDSITVGLAENDEIRDVLARHGASLDAEEMDVTAAAIRLFFEDGGISRMVAMPWQPRAGAEASGEPARVVNAQFSMTADSLDVLAPQQQLQEAVAVGNAHVQRVTPDSLRALLPEASDEVMHVIAHDWMRGDTIRAFFTDGPEPAAGVAAASAAGSGERVLDRLSASGEPAQAMHRMRPEDAAADAKLSIAYLVGRQVAVTFNEGVVAVVSASEDVRGVYLQPGDAARQSGGTPARRGR